MNWSAEDGEEVPPGVVTVTSTVPLPAGEVAVIVPSTLLVKPVAGLDPKSTAVAPERLEPLMVTEVPPPVGPELGLTLVTDGVPK